MSSAIGVTNHRCKQGISSHGQSNPAMTTGVENIGQTISGAEGPRPLFAQQGSKLFASGHKRPRCYGGRSCMHISTCVRCLLSREGDDKFTFWKTPLFGRNDDALQMGECCWCWLSRLMIGPQPDRLACHTPRHT